MTTTKTKAKKSTKSKAAPKGNDRLRKAAIAEIGERIAKLDGEPTKATKTAQQPKPKRTSALDAAAQVLAGAKEPMTAGALITAMAERGLWTSPGGKTPHATLYAAIVREIKVKGTDARFSKTDRGLFAFNGKAA